LDTAITTLMGVLFVIALASGLLAWVSKNVWRSMLRTRLFVIIGVASTLGFVALAMVVLP